MNNFYKLLFLYIFLSGVYTYGYGQTYTYNPIKVGCDGTWGNGNCWDKTPLNDPSGCTENISLSPPIAPTECKVNVVINHDLTFTGDLTFGGTNNRISVGNGAKFNVTGNVTIGAERQVEFNVLENSEYSIGGELVISLGANNPNTILNINGDGTANVFVGSIDLKGRAILNIEEDGRLISSGPTKYNGNSSRIDVYGFFRTSEVDIQGGSDHQLNSYGSAKIIIDGDIILGGTSDITFNGDSEIDVGGEIDNSGNAKIIASDDAKVYYCGSIKKPENAIKKDNGDFINSCRLLPVDLLYFNFDFSPQENVSILYWSTAKEWENSHFEIERSDLNVKNFRKIGEIKGIGWTDAVTEYSFEDKNLPISGGTVYYRLKQVDLDGKFEYSSIVSLNLPELHLTQGIWRAYPNPTDGEQLRIGLLDRSEYNGENLTFRIIHTTAVSESITVSNEVEMNEILASKVAKMPKGLFVIEIRWGQKVEYIKVLYQK